MTALFGAPTTRLTSRTSPRKHCCTRRNSYRESESAPMPSSKSDDGASPRELSRAAAQLRASARQLVPDATVRAEFGVSSMTIFRWDADATLGFPRAVVIRNKKYRFRDELEAFKANLVELTASGVATTSAPPPNPNPRRPAKSTGGLVSG
jgi:hypothetical protein